MTIVSDDLPAHGILQFDPAVISAGESAGTASFTVTRTEGSDGAVTVDYAVTGGTATGSGTDYTLASGTLSFGNGETSKTITVAITDDSVYEANETVIVALSNATGGASIGTSSIATLTIVNNDSSGISGGGGNSGSTAQATTSTSGQITVDGNIVLASSFKTETVGGLIITTVALDDQKTQQKIIQARDKAEVLISVRTGSPDEVTGTLNAQTVRVMQSQNSVLRIDTGSAIYTLPTSKIDMEAIQAWAGEDTKLEDIKVNISVIRSASDTAKIAENTAADGGSSIVVSPVEFLITCTAGDRSTVVNGFNGYVDRMVAIPAGADIKKITTGVVLNRDGSFSHVPTVVVNQGGKYYARMNSLTNSAYLVIWNPVTFKDVESHIFKHEVNEAASRLIIDGLDKGGFGPDIKITRGEFVETIVRALGLLRTDKTTDKFKDVKPGSKYMASAAAAFEYGIAGGYGDGTFRPDRLVTREEAMNLIVRAMKVMGMDTEITDKETSAVLEKYSDGDKVNKIAVKSAAICVKNDIFSGSPNGNLSPAENISRGQTAAVIIRLLKKEALI